MDSVNYSSIGAGLILIWIVCAFSCAYIANTKNRDTIGYFFLGFFFGILGLIIAIAVPVRENNSKQCPFCAEFVKPEAVICKHCGSRLQ